MKITSILAGVALSVFTLALPAQSQTSEAVSGSNSTANGIASSGAIAGSSNTLIFNTPAGTTSSVSGTTTLKTAPPVQAPSMGSGHPCGLATSGGISIIGGGLSGGGSYVDEACLLAQMGQGEAALIMIAQRDPTACKALRQVGRIGANSACSASEKRAQEKAARQAARPVSTSSRSASTAFVAGAANQNYRVAGTSVCQMSGGKLRIKYLAGADKANAKATCLAVHGY